MGACCTGKEHKGDHRNEEVYTKNTKNLTSYINTETQEIELEYEKTEFSKSLNKIIQKCQRDQNKIKKMTIEQLWNISIYYSDDHSNSDFYIYDLRDGKNKTENFIKKFKMINYTQEQLNMLVGQSFERFIKYVKDKNIIIISEACKNEQIEGLINHMYDINVKVNFYLLDIDMINTGLSKTNAFLIDQLNHSDSTTLPYIFIPLKYFPRICSENLIFINFEISEIKLSPQFVEQFSIDTVVRIGPDISENHKKIEKGLNIININMNKIEDLISKKNVLLEILTLMKNRNNKSFLFQIDNKNTELFVHLLLLFIWKLTDVTIRKIKNFLIENFIFNENIFYFIQNEYNRIDDFFKKNFDLIERSNSLALLPDLDTEKNKNKLEILIKNLKMEIRDPTKFNQILFTIDKVIQNVIDNPGNEFFYSIATDSKTFREIFEISGNCLNILELLGFIKNEQKYSLLLTTDISVLISIKNEINNVMNKYIYII